MKKLIFILTQVLFVAVAPAATLQIRNNDSVWHYVYVQFSDDEYFATRVGPYSDTSMPIPWRNAPSFDGLNHLPGYHCMVTNESGDYMYNDHCQEDGIYQVECDSNGDFGLVWYVPSVNQGAGDLISEDQLKAFLDGFWFSIATGMLCIFAWLARSLGHSAPPLA